MWKVKVSIGLHSKVTVHSLRHSFVIQLLEQGVDLRMIQIFLDHTAISSTTIYTHLRDFRELNIKSPLDVIADRLILS